MTLAEYRGLEAQNDWLWQLCNLPLGPDETESQALATELRCAGNLIGE